MPADQEQPSVAKEPRRSSAESPDGNLPSSQQQIRNILEQPPSREIADVWQLVSEQSPELRCLVPLIQRTSRFHGGTFRAPLNEESDIRLEFSDADLHVIEELMIHRKRSVELVAHQLGIAPDALTPRLLKIFIFLHEIGHAFNYIHDFLEPRIQSGNKNPKTEATAAYGERFGREIASLPLPKAAPSTLAQWVAIPPIFWDHVKHYAPSPDVFATLSKRPPEEIVREQEEAYKKLESEQIADTFAADFIRKNSLIARFS